MCHENSLKVAEAPVLKMPQIVAKSMHNIIRQLCGELQPGWFSSIATMANWGLSERSWTSDKLEKTATEKADRLAVGNNTHMYC